LKGNFVTLNSSRTDQSDDAAEGPDAKEDTANGILPRAGSGRRLRNWIILANIAAWILIALVIGAIFF